MARRKEEEGTSEPEFFSNFRTENPLPITWQEMVNNEVVLSPRYLDDFLRKARDYLIKEPGPNQAKRAVLVPEWFRYWNDLLWRMENPVGSDMIQSSGSIMQLGSLKQEIEKKKRLIIRINGGDDECGRSRRS